MTEKNEDVKCVIACNPFLKIWHLRCYGDSFVNKKKFLVKYILQQNHFSSKDLSTFRPSGGLPQDNKPSLISTFCTFVLKLFIN